jgi:FHS family Na+ dependent glucose MFS transporter 1
MVSGMSGPTILDLQLTVGTTFDQITYVIPSRSVGYAMGSLFVGFVFAYLNVQALIAITCGLSAIFLGILPFNRTLWGLIVTFFANGLVNGMLDTGSNLMVLVLWGKENGPFMQALHFSFGLGAFHAPLLAKPFLLELLEPSGNRTSDDNSTFDYQDYVFPEYTVDDVALEIPYGVMAVFMIINSVVFSYLFLKFRET